MRVKNINFTTDTVDEPLGYIGEHNETQLLVTPPTELTDNTDIATYRLAFGVNGSVYYSEATPKAETFTVDLWQDVTAAIVLYIQVEGNDADGELIAKSQRLAGKFLPSVEGKDETADFTAPIIAEISANTAARHTHSNKTVLDELDEDINGDLTYKGNGFATDAELALKQDILTAGNNITIDSDNVISADIDNTREIATANNPYLATYTPAELKAFYDAGLLLTYTNKPLVWGSYEGGTFHFGLVYTSRNGDVIHYWTDAYVNASKVITLSTEQTAVRSVNSKLAGNANGNVTLQAGDISAASGWTPSADTDLATKKYVDDNAGSPDWSDIQNKPNFATVATSGDYDDLINKPTIPAAQIQADWNEADNTALDYIKNKPATMPPTAHTHTKSDITDFPSLATVATSGSYNDLLNQPTIPDISGCEVTSNKVTAIDNTSTDTQYPSAKCVYDGLALKQDTLTAGTNITIDSDNVISATGGGSLPSGTANGDILVWDNTAQDWNAKQVRLPFAYQEVQYIESTGTQFIKLDRQPTINSKIIARSAFTELSSNAAAFGMWSGGNVACIGVLINTDYRCMFSNDGTPISTGINADLNVHTFSLKSGEQKIDSSIVGTNTPSSFSYYPNNLPFYIFAISQGWDLSNPKFGKIKLYEFLWYEGQTLVYYLIPCYNKTTNDIGLFDLVNYKFYGNNGTGTFTKGADV